MLKLSGGAFRSQRACLRRAAASSTVSAPKQNGFVKENGHGGSVDPSPEHDRVAFRDEVGRGAVNAHPTPAPYAPPPLQPEENAFRRDAVDSAHWRPAGSWSDEEIRGAQHAHVMATWGPTKSIKNAPILERASGVYLYDTAGKQYIDWTSQAVCTNLGHTVPPSVQEAVAAQLQQLPFVYPGLGMNEIRCRLSKLMAEILPGDINGFLFPTGGAEANEAAVRIARRYTGRHKIVNLYRSYHGGTTTTAAATGDFRRWFAEQGATGFIKAFNPTPFHFSFGETAEEASLRSLAYLEEMIEMEGPQSIAAIMTESVIGSGGSLLFPPGYMQGVRALCDKYGILFIADEVMMGFGRTGKFWGFQHHEGVVPDIVTSAKGLSGSYLPLSVVGLRAPLQRFFEENPLGWGATYAAHPVSMACAYECIKYMLDQDLVGNAARLEPVMIECSERLMEKHPSVQRARAIGLFGCLDLCTPDGRYIQPLSGPEHPALASFKKARLDEGVYGLLRAPYLHTAPPLVITEEELRDGFDRVDRALDTLDRELGF
jgi:adenosylmethionine-8-amino-7-oxononanoate aminotransferase